MANEFIIKNGFFSQGSSNITGSLALSGAVSTVGQGYFNQGVWSMVYANLFGAEVFRVTYTTNNFLLGTTTDSGYRLNVNGSSGFNGNAAITGSLIVTGNLNVIGTSSFTYTTASIVQVGSNIITLNTNNPATRFGGITVVDSGSFGTASTGSLFWDSLNNKWIYSNPSGSTYSGGMLISGPRNTSSLGNETGMDSDFVAVGQGSDHIRPGSIYNSGSITQVTGSLTATSFTGSIRAVQTATTYAGYFQNNGFNLAGNNAIQINDGGPGTILGLGYGSTSTDTIYSSAQGLYLVGHGSFGVYVSTGFSVVGKARIGDAQFNTGGTLELISAGSGSATTLLLKNTATTNILKVTDNGTMAVTGSLRINNLLIASGSTMVGGFNPTPLAGTIQDGVTSVLGNLQNWNTDYYQGDVLYSETAAGTINFGQICYRTTAGTWELADATAVGVASTYMLGICVKSSTAANPTSILIRGFVQTTYITSNRIGQPMYLKDTAGSMNNVAPSTAGNIVRIVGHTFWTAAGQSNGVYILHFNPDNTWIEL